MGEVGGRGGGEEQECGTHLREAWVWVALLANHRVPGREGGGKGKKKNLHSFSRAIKNLFREQTN